MTKDQVAKVLLVRAVEESQANLFGNEDLRRAHAQAGTEFGQQNWFVSRAAYLIGLLPTAYLTILEMAKLPGNWLPGICVLAFFSGIAANYLGPPGRIHVLFNPIMLLAAWNLGVYLAIVIRRLLRRRHRSTPDEGPTTAFVSRAKSSLPWGLKHLLPLFWKLSHALGMSSNGSGSKAAYAEIVGRFWLLWSDVAAQMILGEWRRMRHLIGVSLALGAIAGIYLRGLFFEYNVVWTSTFIKSQQAVAALMELALAPAFWIARLFGSEPNLPLLMAPEGSPAAEWIHIYAITAVIFVIVPRLALATWETSRAGLGHKILVLRFDAYYTDRVEPQLRAMIDREVRNAITACAEKVSNFAAEELYERRIAPEMNRFRREGGRISDLKQTIETRCLDFQPQLNNEIDKALIAFQTDLGTGIARVVKSLQPNLPLGEIAGGVSWGKQHTDQIAQTVSPVGHSFADAINTIVSLSVATTAATISGGFGESLGIAVLVELTAISGPLGFVIGGLTALVVTAAGLWLGREKITGAIESVSIPGVALRGFLWSSRYEKLLADGKAKARASVKRQMEEFMAPLAPKIADGIWLDIDKTWHGAKTGPRG